MSSSKSTSSTVIPVILCGGSGTRLWPLPPSGFPKQFLVLSGDESGKSLFQQALERLNTLSENKLGPIVVVTNEEHRFLVLDQLREMSAIKATLLLPIGRNTAPALTLATLYASEQNSGEVDPNSVIKSAHQAIPCELINYTSIKKYLGKASGKLKKVNGIVDGSEITLINVFLAILGLLRKATLPLGGLGTTSGPHLADFPLRFGL